MALQKPKAIYKSPNTKHEQFSFVWLKLLIRIIQETSKILQVTAIALGRCPEVEGKTLPLKAPYNSDTGPRGP